MDERWLYCAPRKQPGLLSNVFTLEQLDFTILHIPGDCIIVLRLECSMKSKSSHWRGYQFINGSWSVCEEMLNLIRITGSVSMIKIKPILCGRPNNKFMQPLLMRSSLQSTRLKVKFLIETVNSLNEVDAYYLFMNQSITPTNNSRHISCDYAH